MSRDDAGPSSSRGISRKRRAKTLSKPVYGNFQRYYHIRNPASSDRDASIHSNLIHPALAVDSRVTSILKYLRSYYAETEGSGAQMTPRWAPPQYINVLDIGCNSGKLAIELAQTLPRLLRQCGPPASSETDDSAEPRSAREGQCRILGVDIDPSLIKQAKIAAAAARSRCRPKHITSVAKKIEEEYTYEALPPEARHFPSVFPWLYGRVPSPVNEDNLRLSPPHLKFVALDWVSPEPRSHDTDNHSILTSSSGGSYDVVQALSVTKWIHIQQGDAGLIRFFARIAASLKPGALLFLERQEWPSYHSARGLDSTMKAKVKRLKMRPDGDFDWWLETFGVKLEDTIGEGVGMGFCRPLQVFRKTVSEGEEAKKAAELVDQILDVDMEMEAQAVVWVARSPASSGRAAAN